MSHGPVHTPLTDTTAQGGRHDRRTRERTVGRPRQLDRDQRDGVRQFGVLGELLRPGKALDLGTGEGSDTSWLAERGWSVTAVDISATALARVAERVDGLPVTVECHDLALTFPAGTFGMVSALYLRSPDDAFPRDAILRRAAEAVAPGGTLLIVGHGGLAPHGCGAPLRMPAAGDVLAALALDPAAGNVECCETVERVATGPDGKESSIPDEIVQARRR